MKTTEPKAVTYTMLCRLVRHVITDEGDFVPAGTPVKVMGWKGNGMTDPEMTDAERAEMTRRPVIEVRTVAYMYADSFDTETGRSFAVGGGLYLSVEPDNLVFDEMNEDYRCD